MELGRCFLRCTRSNIVYSALHETHGLAWTDGKDIYLTDVSIVNGEVEKTQDLKLGSFSEVESVHWSVDLEPPVTVDSNSKFCYLCVVRKELVSLWQVVGCAPNLSLKQVRKIHSQPIPQGCLWNPYRDMLCVLTKKKCSFYFNHTLNKGSYSLPAIESGFISCGCWSPDGKKLVVGIGGVVVIYQWQDVDKSISEYTIIAWKIPDVSSGLCSLIPYIDDKILCTVELPLDQLCTTQERFFDIPDLTIFDTSRPQKDKGGKREEAAASNNTYVCLESPTESLLNLRRNTQQFVKPESSQLILFDLQNKSVEPRKLAAQNLQGILSPDILYCETAANNVIVGSHSQNTLHLYTVEENSLVPTQLVQLGDDERPKGVCSALRRKNGQRHVEGILAMVAKKPKVDHTFLPASSFTDFDVTLKYISLPGQSTKTYVQDPKELPNTKMFREIQLPNGSSKVHLLRISPLRNHGNTNSSSSDQEETGHYKNSANSIESSTISSDGTANEIPSYDSSKTVEQRTESPEFNMVLPNTNEITLRNEEITSTNIVVLNSSTSISTNLKDGKNSPPLEVEKTTFGHKPVKFKNRVKRFFENNGGGMRASPCADKRSVSVEEGYVSTASEGDVVVGRVYSASQPTVRRSNNSGDIAVGPVYSASQPAFRRSNNSGDIAVDPVCSVKEPESRQCNDSGDNNSELLSELRSKVTYLENEIKSQKHHISELQLTMKCTIEDLSKEKYSTMSDFSVVQLQTTDNVESPLHNAVQKSFLLDRGRIKLDAVKDAFKLSSVEFLLGGVFCVVGCDRNGYIPMELQPNSVIQISGQKLYS